MRNLTLDVVPDGAQGGLDDGRLDDGGGGWNRHCDCGADVFWWLERCRTGSIGLISVVSNGRDVL